MDARTLNPCARLFTPDPISSAKHISLLFFQVLVLRLIAIFFIILSHEQKKRKIEGPIWKKKKEEKKNLC